MAKFGKYAADGSVEVEATECILTERPLNPPYGSNTVRYPVEGTKIFYRVLASQHHRMTEDMQKEWAREARKQDAPASFQKKNAPVSEVKE
jgi:hypothetical protein